MKRIRGIRAEGCWWLFLSLCLVFFASACNGEEVKRISKEELRGMLGNPDLVIVDVRQPDQWKGDKRKISGAVREEPDQVSAWVGKYPKEKTLVFYCT